MQWLIAGFIDLVLRFLEVSFQKKRSGEPSEEDFFNNGNQQTATASAERLRKAYTFLELEPPVTEDELNKQYKTLSRRYHPDRNGGSNEQFQILHESKEIIRKNITGEDKGNDNDDNGSQSEQEESKPNARARRKAAHQADRKQKKEEQERKTEFDQQKRQDKKRCQKERRQHHFESKQARDSANREFERNVCHYQRVKTDSRNSPTPGFLLAPIIKPSNNLMDCNSDELVTALRLEMHDVALKLMESRLSASMEAQARKFFFEGIAPREQHLMLLFFLQELDEDGNSLLHYAIYYESQAVVRAVCSTGMHYGLLPDMVGHTNKRGQTPLFFAQMALDESILTLVQAQLDYVKQVNARTKVLPALHAAAERLRQLLSKNFGFVTSLETLLSLWIAYSFCNLHIITCLVGLFLANMVHSAEDDMTSPDAPIIPGAQPVASLVSFCSIWCFVRSWVLPLLFQYVKWWHCLVFGLGLHSQGFDLLAFLFSPLMIHAKATDWVAQDVLSMEWLYPRIVRRKGLVQVYLLILTSVTLSVWPTIWTSLSPAA